MNTIDRKATLNMEEKCGVRAESKRLAAMLEVSIPEDFEACGSFPEMLAQARHECTNYDDLLYCLSEFCEAHRAQHGNALCVALCGDDTEKALSNTPEARAYMTIKAEAHDAAHRVIRALAKRKAAPDGPTA